MTGVSRWNVRWKGKVKEGVLGWNDAWEECSLGNLRWNVRWKECIVWVFVDEMLDERTCTVMTNERSVALRTYFRQMDGRSIARGSYVR